MALPRIYLDQTLEPGAVLALPDSASHHLTHVLRRSAGDALIVFNGRGGEYTCEITEQRRKATAITVGNHNSADRCAQLQVHLGMCVIKKDAMDAVITRTVELGVSSITPLLSEHCAVSPKVIRNRVSHWQKVIIAACEQCGLNRLPVLHTPIEPTDWMQAQDCPVRLIAVPDAATLQQSPADSASVALIVGPEGGFSEAELAGAHQSGFVPVTFGQRVLRAETAPAVAMAVVQRVWGDF